MRRGNKWLILIVVLGAVLRLWGLGNNPPGLYWDEVSLGWNAYSILKTGRDEHGRQFPVDTFFAFGDYKPPGYIYAVVPSIAIFGLNEMAVRLPSALAGIGLVVVTYFLTKELLSGKSKVKSQKLKVKRLALLAALLVAISPWSVTLSRAAFESNLAVFLNALGVLFFLYAVKGKTLKVFKINLQGFLVLSVVSFVLAADTFNANRLLSPIFLIGLSLIYFNKAWRNWRVWGIGVIFGAILVMPMIGHLKSPEGKLRWREVNIFSDLEVIKTSNARREVAGETVLARIFNHRYLGYTRLYLKHYLDHFDLNYLFLDGDVNPRLSVPDMGQLYLIELPFFLIGMVGLLVAGKYFSIIKDKKSAVVMIFWLLAAVVPAGMARETPHALRSASVLPIPHILSAMGVMAILKIMNSRQRWDKRQSNTRKSYLFLISYFLFLIFGLARFQIIYWRYYPDEWAGEWLTSYKPLVNYVRGIESNYENIYVTRDLGRPYIYFLFYNRYEPQKYITEAISGGRTGDVFGFYRVGHFSKYYFDVGSLDNIKKTDLVVTRADPPPEGFELLETITDTNGFPQFSVIKRV